MDLKNYKEIASQDSVKPTREKNSHQLQLNL